MEVPRHVIANYNFVARIAQECGQLVVWHQVHLHDGDLQDLADYRRLAPGADPYHSLFDPRPDLVPQFLLGNDQALLRGFGRPFLY